MSIVSSRQSSIVAIIAHDGHVVWQIGPDFSATPELKEIGQIIGQHHAHMIPPGLPGAGNLMVFDNGGASGYGDPSPISPLGKAIYQRAILASSRNRPDDAEAGLAVSRAQLLQHQHQLRPAPAQRQHADHRGRAGADLRGHARQGDRLGIYEPRRARGRALRTRSIAPIASPMRGCRKWPAARGADRAARSGGLPCPGNARRIARGGRGV